MERRRFLLSGGAVGAIGLSGCLGGDEGGDSTPLSSHPISDGLPEQPSVGSADAETMIVGFEDPSCHACHRFETTVFPEIQQKMIETGETRFVYRLFTQPVQPWGTDASKALEATYASDESVFWSLKGFYYDEFDFTTQDVLPRTRDFLEETSVDAEAVVESASSGEFDGEIASDREVGQRAGVGGTPTFFLVDDDSVVAKVVGPQSPSVFRNALGL